MDLILDIEVLNIPLAKRCSNSLVKPLEVSAKYACRFGLLKVSILEFTFAHERYMICISYIYIDMYIGWFSGEIWDVNFGLQVGI